MKILANIITKPKIWQVNILLFVLLVVIVVFLQYDLLKPALELGLTPDDWSLRFRYKVLGSNPLARIAEVWTERGLYTTYQVYYIGLLENLLGFDYQSFQLNHIIFKTLATLAIFPLVAVIFKDRLLAYLTTIFYAISPASVGSLEFVVKGSDYAAIFFMLMFLLIYYKIITSHSRSLKLLVSGSILLLLTMGFSPIRLYPLLILVPLLEIYLLIKNPNLTNLKDTFIRMSVLYLPFLALLALYPNSILGFLQSPKVILTKIIEGNWHLILSPFSGVGNTFIATEYWGKIFGLLTLDSFKEYLYFLLGGPTVIFGILTLLIAFLKSKKPLLFFLSVFVMNFIAEILVFFIAKNYQDPAQIYPALLGNYILVLGFVCFIEWLATKGRDNLLFAFWVGSLFLFIFTFGTWAFAPVGTGFSPTSYYLVVAALGTSLFTAALLAAIYHRIQKVKTLVFLLIIPIFLINRESIHTYFNQVNTNGRSADDQQMIQSKFKKKIAGIDLSKQSLFYFDTSQLHGQGRFYTESFLSGFPFWMHFEGNQLVNRCLEVLYYSEHKQLLQHIKEENGQKGFFYRGLCVNNGKASYKDIFYKPENFYAFKLKDRDFIDIKEEVLKELGLYN